MTIYRTSEVVAVIGVHPNTVRLYEEWGLIPATERQPNGYRVFTAFHIQQFFLARTAFQIEVLQGGMRKKIFHVVKLSAKSDFTKATKAILLTQEYVADVRTERSHADEAIHIVQRILSGETSDTPILMKRKEVSDHLGISMDTLRNWKMNGLLNVKRRQNGYRIYTEQGIKHLKIIRSLRCANYSLEAILRILQQLSQNPDVNIKLALNTPRQDDDIISVCDKLITSLASAERNAMKILDMLQKMKEQS